jgi:hypothetical protein
MHSASLVCSNWLACECNMHRVGQNRTYTYIPVYMVISKPKVPYVHCVYVVLANPKHASTASKSALACRETSSITCYVNNSRSKHKNQTEHIANQHARYKQTDNLIILQPYFVCDKFSCPHVSNTADCLDLNHNHFIHMRYYTTET